MAPDLSGFLTCRDDSSASAHREQCGNLQLAANAGVIEAIEEVVHPSIVMTPSFGGLNRELSIVATCSIRLDRYEAAGLGVS
jgi:hypothetical protein